MEFPRLVYRCPGPHQRAGGTFDHRSAEDADEFDAALADGWHATLPDAVDALTAPKEKPDTGPAADDSALPTRAELEQKAQELGIKFDGRTGDKKLGEMIAAALKE